MCSILWSLYFRKWLKLLKDAWLKNKGLNSLVYVLLLGKLMTYFRIQMMNELFFCMMKWPCLEETITKVDEPYISRDCRKAI